MVLNKRSFMGAAKMLVVEDDESLREAIDSNLKSEGYITKTCATAADALRIAHDFSPDLILLDIGLPDKSGFEVCRTIRKTAQMPIVMLSGRNTETEIVYGLEVGADDYIVKPCTPTVLSARLRAILRRQPKAINDSQSEVSIHGLIIDQNRHRVTKDGIEVKLTPTEFKILHYLATRPGWVFTRSQIVASIKQQDFAISERAIDVQMFSLRKHLGALQGIVETVRGVGYRLRDS
jgi:two-component system, OmpR family, alkaline phosphatase synthesis response regulator PhoP